MRLEAGHFYRARNGEIWCCWRVASPGAVAEEHASADCIRVSDGRKEYFYVDGRYDGHGLREHTLIEEAHRRERALVSCPDGTDSHEPADRGFVCMHEHEAGELREERDALRKIAEKAYELENALGYVHYATNADDADDDGPHIERLVKAENDLREAFETHPATAADWARIRDAARPCASGTEQTSAVEPTGAGGRDTARSEGDSSRGKEEGAAAAAPPATDVRPVAGEDSAGPREGATPSRPTTSDSSGGSSDEERGFGATARDRDLNAAYCDGWTDALKRVDKWVRNLGGPYIFPKEGE